MKVFFSRRIGLEAGQRGADRLRSAPHRPRAAAGTSARSGCQTESTGFDDGFSRAAEPVRRAAAQAQPRRALGRRASSTPTARTRASAATASTAPTSTGSRPARSTSTGFCVARPTTTAFAGDDWSAAYSAGYRAHDVEAQIEHLMRQRGLSARASASCCGATSSTSHPRVTLARRGSRSHGVRSWYFEGHLRLLRASVDRTSSSRGGSSCRR